MNNTFSFKRFKNLLVNDGKMYFRNFYITLIVFCCIPVVFWIYNLIFSSWTPAEARFAFISIMVVLAMMIVPSKVYGKANLSNEGVSFAMLPASSLEKFISMFIYCAIVTPVIIFFGSYLVDAFLSIFPFGGFDKPMHIYTFNEIANMINDDKGVVRTWDLGIPTEALLPIGVMRTSFYVGLIQWAAIFMLGNMLFKKHKAAKTFACFLGISYLLSAIFGGIMFANAERIEQWERRVENYSIDQFVQMIHNWMIGGMVISIIITILLLFFTYRKIKTQKY